MVVYALLSELEACLLAFILKSHCKPIQESQSGGDRNHGANLKEHDRDGPAYKWKHSVALGARDRTLKSGKAKMTAIERGKTCNGVLELRAISQTCNGFREHFLESGHYPLERMVAHEILPGSH